MANDVSLRRGGEKKNKEHKKNAKEPARVEMKSKVTLRQLPKQRIEQTDDTLIYEGLRVLFPKKKNCRERG